MYCNDKLYAAFWYESVSCIFGKLYPYVFFCILALCVVFILNFYVCYAVYLIFWDANLSPILWGSKVPPLPSSSLPLPSSPLRSPPLPLEVGPLIQLGGLEERCKLLQWGLGEAPAANDFYAFSGWKNAAGGIQDARFETSKHGLSLRQPNYCEGPSHRGPSQSNYCEGPDLRTLTGSTPMLILLL